jgi:hypothetical protein
MWTIIILIMLGISVLWGLVLRYQFSLPSDSASLRSGPSTSSGNKVVDELKSIRQEFSQMFSKLKEFKFGEILEKLRPFDSSASWRIRSETIFPTNSKRKENLSEEEIEELRKRIFE